MTKLLEQTTAEARNIKLTPEQVADVNRIRSDLRSGQMRLATDDEIAAFWKKCGL